MDILPVLPDFLLIAAEAAEEFVPPDDWRAIVALPAAFLFFFVSVYLLLRSNLGSRRAYLVMATCFFAYMVIQSLYWTTGAPGTPMATGPQTLPGQPPDYYQATWEPFAIDSVIADERFPEVKSFPEGFSAIESQELRDLVSTAREEVSTFFSEPRANVPGPIGGDWDLAQDPQVATAADGTQLVAMTFGPTTDAGEVDPEAETYTAFAFYDPGFLLLPSLITVALSVIGLLLHLALLALDENRERREAEGDREVEAPREPVPARA